jgi:hypothetical protein
MAFRSWEKSVEEGEEKKYFPKYNFRRETVEIFGAKAKIYVYVFSSC